MSEQKKQIRTRLLFFIPVIIILAVVLVTASLLIIDLKTKELASQNLHTLEQQRSTFEISLNYELLKTRSAAEEFAAALQNGKDPAATLALLQYSLASDYILYDSTAESKCYSSSNKNLDKDRSNIHTLLSRKSGFYGPEIISPHEPDAEKKAVFVFSAPVSTGIEDYGFLGGFVYAENIFNKFMPADMKDKGSFVLCSKDGTILTSTSGLVPLGFSVNEPLSGCMNHTKNFIFKNKPAGLIKTSFENDPNGMFIFVDSNGGTHFATFITVPDRNWILLSISSTEDFKANLLYIVATIWALAGLLLIICIIVYHLRSRIYIAREKLADSKYEHERFLREICCDIYENVIEADVTDDVILGKSSDALLEHLNLSKKTSYDEFLKTLVKQVIHPNFASQFYEAFCSETLLSKYEKGEKAGDIVFMDNTYSDNYLWKSAKITLYYSESTNTVRAIIFVRNIDEEKRKELSLIEKSEKDILTNLLNKSSFDSKAKDFLAEAGTTNCHHALVILDIDNFRQINETLGYLSGDSIIMEFIETIKRNIRSEDIVGRLGGVSFAVLIKNYGNRAMLKTQLQILCDELHRQVVHENITCTVTASIGCALYPEHSTSYKELFGKANEALYFSQTHGMDTYTIYESQLLKHQALFVDEKDIDELVNTAADGIAKLAVNPEFTFLYTNQKFLNLIGRTSKDIEADGFMGIKYFHQDDVPQIFEALYFAMEKKMPYSISYRIQHKNGQYISVRTKCLFVNENYNGTPVMYSIFTDITDMVKMNEQLREAKETALAATKAKSNFLASMSHEIRTPMNAIMGMSDLILLDKSSSSSNIEYARNISTACRSLLGIINDILDISKIESGKLTLTVVTYNFIEMINDVITMIKLRAQDKYLDFFVHIDPKIPAEMTGDEIRLKQILLNMLSNAVKYTHEGYLSLTVEGREKDGNYELRFIVSDTGIGIKDEDRKHLFTEFERLDAQKNRNIVGTGLGLSITKKLCEMMNGSISVKSEYGKGSTFTAVVQQSVSEYKPLVDTKDALNKKILYFEPNNRTSKFMMKEFEVLESQVDLCVDVKTATECLENHKDGGKSDYDFVFVGSKYFEKIQQCIKAENLSDLKVVQIAEDSAAVSQSKTCVLVTPVTCIQLAQLLSGNESIAQTHLAQTHNFNRVFAPDAKVLVVDDNSVNLKVAQGLLKTHDIECETANSGYDALGMIYKKTYDLIFMDHLMPDMDGIETTHKIRALENNENSKKPIVALTANALSGMRETFLSEGLNDFLSKPIEPAKLNAILADWLPIEKIKYESAESAQTALPEKAAEPEETAIEGINYQNGLGFAGGDKATYMDILRTFSNDYEKRDKELHGMIEADDIQAFTTNIHGLKSASRYVGADEVSDLAAKLEEAGQKNDKEFIDSHFEECMTLYKTVCQNIQNYLGKETVQKNAFPKGDIQTLKATAELLKQYAYDMDIVNFEEELKKVANYTWDDIIKAKLDDVSQAAYSYDYGKMSDETEKLLSIINGYIKQEA